MSYGCCQRVDGFPLSTLGTLKPYRDENPGLCGDDSADSRRTSTVHGTRRRCWCDGDDEAVGGAGKPGGKK